MNLPELLGTGTSAGPSITAKGGPDEPSSEAGDAFKSSVQSLSRDSERSESDVAQQSGEEASTVGTSSETPDTLSDANEPSGSDAQVSAPAQTATAAPSTVVQSFLTMQANAQTKPSEMRQPSSINSADTPSKALTSGDTSQQGSKLNIMDPEEAVRVKPPSTVKVETGGAANKVLDNGTEPPVNSKPTAAVSQASNVLATQEQFLQSGSPASQKQLGEAAGRQNGTVLKTTADPVQTNKVADSTSSPLKASGDVAVEAKVEPQPVKDQAPEDLAFEKRLHERRSDVSAADAKLSDKASQTQQVTNPATTNTARSGPVIVEFGQPTSSVQTAAAQVAGTREAFAERGTVLNVTPAAAADASSRNTIAQISAAIRNQPQMRTIELSLDPPELGRVEIQMDVAEVGLKATLSAERPGTGDLIRRQAEILLQQLNEAGFSDVDLNFRDFGSGEQTGGDKKDDQNTGQTNGLTGTNSNVAPEARARVQTTSNGMDVRL